MASYNKITLIGNLGRDPELRNISADRKVAEFSIAVTEKYTAGGQQQEKTEWFKISFWNQKADVVMNYLKKGSPVYVEGRLSVRTYVDKEGKDRYSLEVTGSELTLIDSRPREGSENAGTAYERPAATSQVAPSVGSTPEDDLPF